MSDTVVQTASGKVVGAALPGLRCWLGIPYARAGRFESPVPVAPWAQVREALRFGKQCPQAMGGKVKPGQFDNETFGEDCLHLNIYTPEGGAPGPKPVMVWIHGGAFMSGSGDPYDGSALAREGDVVVVTINYRVGVLGFVNFGEALGLPQIPGNLGLRDQIAALEWVRDNIAGFGGDPAKVTIAGQSAGSLSVSLLMLSPKARGLFRGAIAQSGAVSLIHDRERSIQDARAFAEVLGLDQGGLERLRTMPLDELFAAQVTVGKAIPNGIPAAPWFDGDLLPATLEDAGHHAAAPVPLLAGATRDEIVLFSLMPGDILPTRWPELEALLFAQLPRDHAERVLAAYPRTRKGRIALASDLTFVMPTRNFAERQAAAAPTWLYRFDYSHPIAGATHGLDLTLAWPFSGLKMALVRGGPNTGRRKALGERIRADLAHFVREGAAPADWPRYEAETRRVKVYNLADRIEDSPEAARVAAWAGRDVSPGVAR
jgi:para-nitrobenzyl esterase